MYFEGELEHGVTQKQRVVSFREERVVIPTPIVPFSGSMPSNLTHANVVYPIIDSDVDQKINHYM